MLFFIFKIEDVMGKNDLAKKHPYLHQPSGVEISVGCRRKPTGFHKKPTGSHKKPTGQLSKLKKSRQAFA